jgi:hypothetical protein
MGHQQVVNGVPFQQTRAAAAEFASMVITGHNQYTRTSSTLNSVIWRVALLAAHIVLRSADGGLDTSQDRRGRAMPQASR